MNNQPWTLYWQADHPGSCIASTNPEDATAIEAFWRGLARSLAANRDGAVRVLDLATGNGAVPMALLEENPALDITAVDLADIDPLAHLSDPGPLKAVDFLPAVDITAMPFETAQFDAVTSQFGVEYAPLERVAKEVARVLKPGGTLTFLMHHTGSDVLQPVAAKLQEISLLLGRNGVLHALDGFVHQDLPQAELEQAGQRHIQGVGPRTQSLSGQIFEGVNRVIELFPQQPGAARELTLVMIARLGAEQTRLKQMQRAALDPDRAAQFGELLVDLGFSVHAVRELVIRPQKESAALVGWQVNAQKTPQGSVAD